MMLCAYVQIEALVCVGVCFCAVCVSVQTVLFEDLVT